jgi:alcohol dehydrogenase
MYGELLRESGRDTDRTAASDEVLAERLAVFAGAGELPRTLRDVGVPRGDLAALASEAAAQWTGTFNPRPFDTNGALEIYQCAF